MTVVAEEEEKGRLRGGRGAKKEDWEEGREKEGDEGREGTAMYLEPSKDGGKLPVICGVADPPGVAFSVA